MKLGRIAFQSDTRSESELIGTVLLLGLVLAGAAAVLVLGTAAMTDVRESVTAQDAELSMREVDARLSKVTYSGNTVQTLNFDTGQNSDVSLESGSYMNITLNDSADDCREQLELGSIVQSVDGGTDVAYEAGGVWQKQGNHTSMVSPPDLQYENGTINFPVVSIEGKTSGSVDSLQASKNVSASLARSRAISETFSKDACNPPSQVNVTVKSEYYEAWERYFESHIGGPTWVDHDNQTARIQLVDFSHALTINDTDDNVSSDVGFTADLEVLGTEGSVSRNWDGDDVELNDPFSIWPVLEGEGRKTPWMDSDPGDTFHFPDDDPNVRFNDSRTFPNPSVSVAANQNLSVEAAIHNCREDNNGGSYDQSNWYDTGIEKSIPGENAPYEQWRCNVGHAELIDDTQVQIDTSEDKGSNNLIVLRNGDEIPGVRDSQHEYQRDLNQILGSRVKTNADGNEELVLDSNQVVYVYELSEYLGNTEPEDSDKDFNDAIVLATFNTDGGGTVDDFSIHVSVNQVTVRPA